MPVLYCPRCQRSNPEIAEFCYFDGAELRSRQDGSFHRLGQEFVFPSGRRCRSFDDFAQGCRDEWPAARDLLRQGVFKQFFGGTGRTDLAQVAHEAMAQQDADIALTTFLDALPVLQTSVPKIDINPRRLLLGNLLAGEQRQLQIIVSNQGTGSLQGTLTIREGGDWIKIDGPDPIQCAIATQDASTRREQKIPLKVDTRGLPAGGTFGAKLTVITNGGVVEVMARMELVAQPFTKAPFQGAKTPRDMAERMRKLPKAAVPMLENGDVSRWFTSNGWNFPIRGPQAKGVAGVQQYFETMGLSKPPVVQMSQAEIRLASAYPETVRSQVVLQTAAKKWVYAAVASDSPWLRVLSPQVGGPQQATITFEIDPKAGAGTPLEGKLLITANGGKVLTVKVSADVRGAPQTRREPARPGAPAPPGKTVRAGTPVIVGVPLSSGGLLRSVLAMALAFVLLRLLLVPLVDLEGRSRVVAAAAAKLSIPVSRDAPVAELGGWLQLPWSHILTGADGGLATKWFAKTLPHDAPREVPMREFRHYFESYFLRLFVLYTWWLGAVAGAIVVVRHGGGFANLPWGIVAGAVAGVAASVTLGSLFLVVEVVPHALWDLVF
ncbi:MAG TPA: hypothetical protein VNX28_14835, partial [Gemmataceae bacterium]|nr:hypothetical protein [Gemmataceae bacterium]